MKPDIKLYHATRSKMKSINSDTGIGQVGLITLK